MKYVIGLDIGTTSAKAVLFQTDGSVISEAEELYPTYHPYPNWSEQNPEEVELSLRKCFKKMLQLSKVDTNQILAVGFSCAMHSLLCLDQQEQPLSPSIIWADSRGTKQADMLKEHRTIYHNTGTPIHPMSPLVKLKWMQETEYEPYKKAKYFISIKEYILRKWFQEQVIDYSIASATGLFNIHTLGWDQDALALVGIHKAQLGRPIPSTYVLGPLQQDIAMDLGISTSTPFVIGGSDGPLANLGVGAIEQGETAITIGTSGAIRQFSSEPITDIDQSLFCYAFTKDLYIVGGPSNNGGIALQWLKELLGNEQDYETLNKWVATINAGSEGVIFHPYLNGERAPIWQASAKASFFGLTIQHSKRHLSRSVMEGVIYNLYEIGEKIEKQDPIKKLLANGGFARSAAWLQILADVFNREVFVPVSHQSAAWGAAWTALVGINQVNSFTDIKNALPMDKAIQPKQENVKVYKEYFTMFKKLRHALQEFY